MPKHAHQEYLVDEQGNRKAVVVPLEEYERLLEDLHDLAVVAERRDEPSASLEEVKARLRVDGILPS